VNATVLEHDDALPELAHELRRAIGIGGEFRFAGKQMARIGAALKYGLGDLQSGGVISVREPRSA